MRMRDWVILSGNANRPLAQKICDKLGKPLGSAESRRFSDGEARVIHFQKCYAEHHS